ncbi:MAG: ScyD/ScyE family protein [Verrucomicrobiota bacterium]
MKSTTLVSCLYLSGNLLAQNPCPDLAVVTTGLLGPNKIIQTPLGNYLVSEIGTSSPNNGRISIVTRDGQRRTVLDGLPSAREFLGNISGPSGLALQNRTLLVVTAFGDSTLAGPVQGTEKANAAPASPLFSAVLALDFPEALETNTFGFKLTLADHFTLKQGSVLTLTNSAGEQTTVRLVADFADHIPEPRPDFADNVRHSSGYGIVADETFAYVIDAGMNSIRKIEIASGHETNLVNFLPTPSPLPNGPRVIENVPTSIHWVGRQLLVTTFGGAPFLPGYSQVVQINPESGALAPLVQGLTTAVDAAPLSENTVSGGLLTLEHNLGFPQPGLGQLRTVALPGVTFETNSICLESPSSMLIDRGTDRLILAELASGRLASMPRPLSRATGETWSKRAAMPTPRFLLATALLEGAIYAIGGTAVGGGSGLSAVESYSIEADSWTVRAPLPTPRGWFGAKAVNGKIYAIGGDGVAFLTSPLKTVEEYDPVVDRWTRKADMLTAREGFATAVVGGKIYILGGLTTRSGPPLALVEFYDPQNDSWERKAPMPTARGMLCAAVLNGQIYAMGGAGPGFPLLSTTEMYVRPRTPGRKASMPSARGVGCAGRAWTGLRPGQEKPRLVFSAIHEYDPASNSWTRRTNLWTVNPRTSAPLFGFGVEEAGGRVYTIGGAATSEEKGLTQVLEYIPPIVAPTLTISMGQGAGSHPLSLQWKGDSDYVDVLEERDELASRRLD